MAIFQIQGKYQFINSAINKRQRRGITTINREPESNRYNLFM